MKFTIYVPVDVEFEDKKDLQSILEDLKEAGSSMFGTGIRYDIRTDKITKKSFYEAAKNAKN